MARRIVHRRIKLSKNKRIALVVVSVLISIVLVALILTNNFDFLNFGKSNTICTSLLSDHSDIVIPDKFNLDQLLEVHFIDVGQGDGIVIMLPDGKIFFIDGGSGTSASKQTRQSYNNYLKNNLYVDKVEYLVVTHPHTDHYNLLDSVLDFYDVDMIFYNVDSEPSKSYDSFCAQASSEDGVEIKSITNGNDSILIVESQLYKITIFSAGNDGFGGAKSVKNSMSVVCLLEYGKTKVLFMGDAEKETEQWLSKYALDNNIDLDVDVLKVGHHGSNSGTTNAFLDSIQAEYAIISCGENNSFDHPSKEVMQSLFYKSVATYRTDKHGSIVLYVDYDGDFGFLTENNVLVENSTDNSKTIPLIIK